MIEDKVKIVVDDFNRFRRPLAEAKLLIVEEDDALIEFACTGDVKEYAEYFRSDLESIAGHAEIESVEGKRVKFMVKNSQNDETDPLQKALRILDKYNEGTHAAFNFED